MPCAESVRSELLVVIQCIMSSTTSSCNLCTRTRKCSCIDCGLCYWMTCSVLEDDETIPAWKLGQSVDRLLLEIEQKITADLYLQKTVLLFLNISSYCLTSFLHFWISDTTFAHRLWEMWMKWNFSDNKTHQHLVVWIDCIVYFLWILLLFCQNN